MNTAGALQGLLYGSEGEKKEQGRGTGSVDGCGRDDG